MRWIYLLFLLISTSSANSYAMYVDAFIVKQPDGKTILDYQDLQCVSIDQNNVDFQLTGSASKQFQEYTSKNTNKTLQIIVCGKAQAVPIRSEISGGRLVYQSIDSQQKSCLEQSFVISTKCQGCPICK